MTKQVFNNYVPAKQFNSIVDKISQYPVLLYNLWLWMSIVKGVTKAMIMEPLVSVIRGVKEEI